MRGFKTAPYIAISALTFYACDGERGSHKLDASHDPAGSDAGDAGFICPFDAGLDAACPGQAQIAGEFNFCPEPAFELTPARAAVDQGVTLISHTIDAEGDVLTYRWSAEPDGRFEPPDAPNTTYRCDSLGHKTLRLTVTDEHGCAASTEAEASCGDPNEFTRSQ